MKSRYVYIAMCLFAAATQAVASSADHVLITKAWIRLLPGQLPAGAYADLANDGDQPAVLRDVSSVQFGSSMLHQSSSEGGMSRMAMVDELTLPAHGHVAMAPGGYHLMLEAPKGPLSVGDRVPLKFQFADGSTTTVNFVVRPAYAMGSD